MTPEELDHIRDFYNGVVSDAQAFLTHIYSNPEEAEEIEIDREEFYEFLLRLVKLANFTGTLIQEYDKLCNAATHAFVAMSLGYAHDRDKLKGAKEIQQAYGGAMAQAYLALRRAMEPAIVKEGIDKSDR